MAKIWQNCVDIILAISKLISGQKTIMFCLLHISYSGGKLI